MIDMWNTRWKGDGLIFDVDKEKKRVKVIDERNGVGKRVRVYNPYGNKQPYMSRLATTMYIISKKTKSDSLETVAKCLDEKDNHYLNTYLDHLNMFSLTKYTSNTYELRSVMHGEK